MSGRSQPFLTHATDIKRANRIDMLAARTGINRDTIKQLLRAHDYLLQEQLFDGKAIVFDGLVAFKVVRCPKDGHDNFRLYSKKLYVSEITMTKLNAAASELNTRELMLSKFDIVRWSKEVDLNTA